MVCNCVDSVVSRLVVIVGMGVLLFILIIEMIILGDVELVVGGGVFCSCVVSIFINVVSVLWLVILLNCVLVSCISLVLCNVWIVVDWGVLISSLSFLRIFL